MVCTPAALLYLYDIHTCIQTIPTAILWMDKTGKRMKWKKKLLWRIFQQQTVEQPKNQPKWHHNNMMKKMRKMLLLLIQGYNMWKNFHHICTIFLLVADPIYRNRIRIPCRVLYDMNPVLEAVWFITAARHMYMYILSASQHNGNIWINFWKGWNVKKSKCNSFICANVSHGGIFGG